MYVTLSEIISMLGMITIKLRENNYLRWRYQFQTVLEGGDLFCYFDGTYPMPPEIVLTDAYKIWKKNDKALLSLLIATLDEDIMDAVVGSKSSKEAWLCLQERFVPSSRADVIQLETNLLSIKKGSDSIERYLLKIKQNRDLLSVVGVTFSDEDIVVLTLNGLPDEYAMLKMVIRGRESPIDAKDFRFQLLAAERDIEGFMCYSSNMSMLGKCHSQKSLDKNSCSESYGGRYNDALVCRNRLNYAFNGSDPCTTLNGMTVHNTNGGTSSGSTSAYGFSCILKSDQLQVIPPTSSTFGNSCDTHIVVSSTVVDGGEQNEVNGSSCDVSGGSVGEVNSVSDNSNSPRSGECVGEVNSVGDNSCSFGSGATSFGDLQHVEDRELKAFEVVTVNAVIGGLRVGVKAVKQDLVEMISVAFLMMLFSVLRVFNHVHSYYLFKRNFTRAWYSLGGGILCTTNYEAVFSNLCYFAMQFIQPTFVCLALPGFLLRYVVHAAFVRGNHNGDHEALCFAISSAAINDEIFSRKHEICHRHNGEDLNVFKSAQGQACQFSQDQVSQSAQDQAYQFAQAQRYIQYVVPTRVKIDINNFAKTFLHAADMETSTSCLAPFLPLLQVLENEDTLSDLFLSRRIGYALQYLSISRPDVLLAGSLLSPFLTISVAVQFTEKECLLEVQMTEDATSNQDSRNNMVWKNSFYNISDMATWVSSLLSEYKLRHKCQGDAQKRAKAKWKYPPRGRLKLNIDGSFDPVSMKLSDELIEETLEKIVKLLAYISDKDLFAAKLMENAATVGCLVGGAIAQLIRTIATKVAGLVITSKMMYEGASRIIDVVGSVRTVVSSCGKEKFGKIPSLTMSISALLPQLRLREGVNRMATLLLSCCQL